jgi:DNA-binding CsgD family transcriptional regulator
MSGQSHRLAGDAPPTGRDAEAARLATLIDDTAAGAKRAALLLGAPGIGKTTLLRFARSHATRRGLVCSFVRVPSTAGLPPRFPLGESLAGFVSEYASRNATPPERLERVVSTLTGATSVDEYAVSLPQIADALEEAGRIGPLGLFIDDYDWAPADGSELLMAALRAVETPVFLLATARLRRAGDEAPSPLPAPTADLWIDHIEIRGLDARAVASVAAGELGREVLPSLADALYARTLGNPLFVAETLQAWRAERALVSTGGFIGLVDADERATAHSLRDMIASRLARLHDDALSAAGVVALIGRGVSFEELVSVLGLSPDELVEHLTILATEGFVAAEGHPALRYRVAHPLYAASVLDRLGPARVAALHGRICNGIRAGSGRPGSASERAHHAVRALHPPDDLRELLEAAAAEAESAGGHEEAAEWYGYLAETTDDPRELVRALAGQASASIRSDPGRAVQLFTLALALETSAPARAGLLLGRARAHRVAGMFDAVMSDLKEALPIADEEQALEVRHAIGVMHGVRGDLDAAEAAFREIAAESVGTSAHWKAIGHLGMVAFIRGDVVNGARLHEEALRATDDPAYASYLGSNLVWMLILIGRWAQADPLLRTAVGSAIAAGNIHDECSLSCMGARLAAWRGELAVAFDYAQRAIRLATRLGNPADVIDARSALAMALLENGMPGDAAAAMSQIVELDRPEVEPREYTYTYTVLAEACLQIGDLNSARVALARAEGHLANARFWEPSVDRLAAQIAAMTGDLAGALDRIARWVQDPSPIAFEHARVLETTARLRLAVGDRTGALSAGQQALQLLEQLGAAKRAREMGAWLVEHATRARGRPRSTLPGRLTERETEILRLVVGGRANREIAEELFISLGTVKKHVENVMAKAGVSRRTELLPFALGIGALSLEDLRPAPGRVAGRVVRLEPLEPSDRVPAD